VIGSQFWSSAHGAVTWCDGDTGCTQPISPTNSLVGSVASDFLSLSIEAITDDLYVALTPFYDNGSTANAGAVTLLNAAKSCPIGEIDEYKSFFGETAGGGPLISYVWDAVGVRLLIAQPASTKISAFDPNSVAVADGNWSADATWCLGVPQEGYSVYIGDKTVTVDVDTAEIKNLEVQEGSLVFSDASGQASSSADASQAAGKTLSFSGDWLYNGTFTGDSGTVSLTGSGEQSLISAVDIAFNNLTVAAGAIFVDGAYPDHFSVTGTLTNTGIIRKTKPVNSDPVGDIGSLSTVSVPFGLSGVVIASDFDMGNVTVDWIESSYPDTEGNVDTGRYWTITATNTVAASLTAPMRFTPTDKDKLCHYVESAWVCAASSVEATNKTITLNDIADVNGSWTGQQNSASNLIILPFIFKNSTISVE